MTALLFKNWGFPHKVFKGVQTFESKKIKETLQIQRFSHFLILPQTGILQDRRGCLRESGQKPWEKAGPYRDWLSCHAY